MAPATRDFVLTDIRMPFWRMVIVIFKFTLAAIPAAILLWLLGAALAVIASMVFGVTLQGGGTSFFGTGSNPQ